MSAATLAPPVRPKFNSLVTSDRLREGAGLRMPASRVSNIRKGRTSVFREEMGADDAISWGPDSYLVVPGDKYSTLPAPTSSSTVLADDADKTPRSAKVIVQGTASDASKPWYAKLANRPALTKRLSGQGRMAVPSVTLSATES
ncbi:hypothetical protein VHEMI06449 [[Torrubiella] hemipterigena]|uniref:Uncharacterized protein n=1 Tax=[Torrubiella] hemipterigena TaxID=1531966 RepID=A0A0A1TL63_9HYPO|nr:hypothetical protein VHEMI06449 [[Torrubiella] hemipterigena]